MEEELKGLNLVDLYDKLIQPEAPVPISLWPQTVGWLWLGAAVVILSALAFWPAARRASAKKASSSTPHCASKLILTLWRSASEAAALAPRTN